MAIIFNGANVHQLMIISGNEILRQWFSKFSSYKHIHEKKSQEFVIRDWQNMLPSQVILGNIQVVLWSEEMSEGLLLCVQLIPFLILK